MKRSEGWLLCHDSVSKTLHVPSKIYIHARFPLLHLHLHCCTCKPVQPTAQLTPVTKFQFAFKCASKAVPSLYQRRPAVACRGFFGGCPASDTCQHHSLGLFPTPVHCASHNLDTSFAPFFLLVALLLISSYSPPNCFCCLPTSCRHHEIK